MGERKIENLAPEPGSAVAREPESVAAKAARTANKPMVDVHYPQPTALSEILHDISRWSGENFAMDPAVNAKLQIFAPHPLQKQDALDLFWASLSIINLRAVRVGPVTKIVPVSQRITA